MCKNNEPRVWFIRLNQKFAEISNTLSLPYGLTIASFGLKYSKTSDGSAIGILYSNKVNVVRVGYDFVCILEVFVEKCYPHKVSK